MLTELYYKLAKIFLGLFDYLPVWNMPDEFYRGLNELVGYMYKFDTIFPVWTLLKATLAVISYFAIARIWNFFSDTLALLRGSGNPKI